MCNRLKIKNFKGVFMRDEVKGKANNNECFIMNIDFSENIGTHWTCLFVKNKISFYFDSYGFNPTDEIIEYCDGNENYYNSFKIQKSDEVICGHYCIYMLYLMDKGIKFYDILNELYFYNNK